MRAVLSPKHIREFQDKILLWYVGNQRDLPWRKTHDPYSILVSEIMSQQTQIMRVVPKYEAWMEELPTVESLANAPVSSVLRLWSGLGYNRRALFLQKAAQEIVRSHNGIFPHTVEDLKKLPGIGAYTAAAVACFAFNTQIPVIDTNIRKVILTVFGKTITDRHSGNQAKREHPESYNRRKEKSDPGLRQDDEKTGIMTEKEIEEIARLLLPEEKARDWNQALMDYAASELKKHKIPLPKQSKLLGSDRYYRGQTIKQLLRAQDTGERVTVEKMHAYFSNQGQKVENERLERIFSGMEKEGFIRRKKEIILLPD